MSRAVWIALLVSLVTHGVLLVALSRPWGQPVLRGEVREWTKPAFLSAFRRESTAGENRAEPARTVPESPAREDSPATPSETPREMPPAPESEISSEVSSDSTAALEDSSAPVSGQPADRPPRLLVGAITGDREGNVEVEVRILVGVDGRVAKVVPVDPAADPDLLGLIREAARAMRFVPALRNGREVAAWLQMGFVL